MVQGAYRKFGRVTSGTRLDTGPGPLVLGEDPWLAAAPVLGPLPATPGLQATQNGAWLLPDQTPLVPALEAFLAAGEPPADVGFGSMPMAAATRSASRIAYLDEDRLTPLGVTFALGSPGKGGIRRADQGAVITGEDGVAVETRRLPESLDWSSPSDPRRWKPARPQARVQRRPWG
ncbi:hypothetical protein [Sorangium sp. So ce233]|uniref:hypothetical protein n=1 Tax=Sorangium sp. So ce233 TaxID=3133290 RepID=UPI003F5F8B76